MKYWITIIAMFFISAKAVTQTSADTLHAVLNSISSKNIKLTSKEDISKANVPLYIVDGKKRDSGYIKNLDPKTIESINVLNGDKAIKKYGKNANNGVIIITTKKDLLLQP